MEAGFRVDVESNSEYCWPVTLGSDAFIVGGVAIKMDCQTNDRATSRGGASAAHGEASEGVGLFFPKAWREGAEGGTRDGTGS